MSSVDVTNATASIFGVRKQSDVVNSDNLTEAECSSFTAFPSVFILLLASLFGTGGNVLVLLAIAKFKKLRKEESVFFINLACADLFVTIFVDPMSAIGMYTSILC